MATDTIAAFLPYAASQKSASLVIAKSELLADEAVEELEQSGFTELADAHDLERGGKHYIRVSKNNANEVYDIAIQYGTGQITLFDRTAQKTTWINPVYEDSAVVFVITEKALTAIEESGLFLRSITGLTTQL